MVDAVASVGGGDTLIIPLGRKELQECKTGVYFIVPRGVNAVKVGKTVDLQGRMSDIQVSNPSDLYCWQFINCESEESAFKVESLLHTHLQLHESHIRGEWYVLSKVLDIFESRFRPTIDDSSSVSLISRGYQTVDGRYQSEPEENGFAIDFHRKRIQ